MPPKTPKPKWKPAEALGAGQQALALAEEQRAALEPRLAAGLIDGLRADLVTLEGKRSETTRANAAERAAFGLSLRVNVKKVSSTLAALDQHNLQLVLHSGDAQLQLGSPCRR